MSTIISNLKNIGNYFISQISSFKPNKSNLTAILATLFGATAAIYYYNKDNQKYRDLTDLCFKQELASKQAEQTEKLEEEIEGLNSEVTKLETSITESSEEKTVKENEKKIVDTEIEKHGGEVKFTQVEMQEKSDNSSRLEKEIKSLDDKIISDNKQLKSKKSKLETLNRKLELARKSDDELKTELAKKKVALEEEKDKNTDTISQLNADINLIQEAIDSRKDTAKKVLKEAKSFFGYNGKVYRQAVDGFSYSATLNHLHQKYSLNQLNQKITDLEGKIIQALDEKTQQKVELKKLGELETLEEKLAKLEGELSAINSSNKSDIASKNTEISDVNENIQKHRKLTEKIKNKETEIKEKQTSLESLKKQLQILNEKTTNNQTFNDNTSKLADALTKEKAALDAHEKRNTGDGDEAYNAELTKLQDRIAILEMTARV